MSAVLAAQLANDNPWIVDLLFALAVVLSGLAALIAGLRDNPEGALLPFAICAGFGALWVVFG